MQVREYQASQYSRLSSVEAAELALKSVSNYVDTMLAVGDIIREAKSEHAIGLWLAHRHFEIADDEFVAERTYATAGGGVEIVAECLKSPPSEHEYAPKHFTLSKGDAGFSLTPHEFTNDPITRETFQDISSLTDVLTPIADKIFAANLENVLGINLIGERELEASASSSWFVEESQPATRQNLSKLISVHDNIDESLIETNWAFSANERAPSVLIGCIRVCVRYSPGHSIQHRRCQRYV